MFERYAIETVETPPARPVANKFHPIVDRIRLAKRLVTEAFHYRFRKDILLSRPCIYGVFSGPVGGFAPRRELCVGCMRCVQEYPDMCRVDINPEWKRLGDSYFDPDSISTLNYEATTGKLMVKGVGYKGPFAGPGFDSMWTDMSEIVRPTRDGIYGREWISTAVDVGRKPARLDPNNPVWEEPVVELPVPFIFDAAPPRIAESGAAWATLSAAKRLKTWALVHPRDIAAGVSENGVPSYAADELETVLRGKARIPLKAVEVFSPSPGQWSSWREAFPGTMVIVRLGLGDRTRGDILELFDAGAGVFHLVADYHGRDDRKRFVGDAVRDLHEALVEKEIRDELTLIVSGGITRAEHVPKIIICGADLVALDTPVWVALGGEFREEFPGPWSRGLDLPFVNREPGVQRIVNFCAAWRDQLLEILSAMGLRDVRRLRGELGRSMDYEALEQEAFRDLEPPPVEATPRADGTAM